MGVQVSGLARLVDAVQSLPLSQPKKSRLIGELVMAAAGERPPMSFATAAEFNRVVRQLNLVLSPELLEGSEVVSRLDFESGREVLCAA